MGASSSAGKSPPYEVRPSSISFGAGPPQVVVYLEHLPKAMAYVRANKIVSIELDTHAPQAQPLLIDFGFLNDLPDLMGFECRMNVSKKTDLAPLHQLKKLKQLGWPARTSPPIDLSHFPELEYLSFRQQPSTPGWDALSKLKVLRLSVASGEDLEFLGKLKSLVNLEVADSPIESLAGIERLGHLEELKLFMLANLTDISSISRCKNLKSLLVDKTKRLTDFSALADSNSIEDLSLQTPIDSVAFVPRMKALKKFFCNDIQDGDLSPLLQAKSLKQLDFYPEKRSYSHKLADIKTSLGI